jgi:hypothetical protein
MIARTFHWRYDWVTDLPLEVYEIIIEELEKQAR